MAKRSSRLLGAFPKPDRLRGGGETSQIEDRAYYTAKGDAAKKRGGKFILRNFAESMEKFRPNRTPEEGPIPKSRPVLEGEKSRPALPEGETSRPKLYLKGGAVKAGKHVDWGSR